MTNDDQILAALEEIASQVGEIKKSATNPEKALANLSDKIGSIEELLRKEKPQSHAFNDDITILKSNLTYIQRILSAKQQEVVHNFIEVKQPFYWVAGFASYFLLSLLAIFLLFDTTSDLKAELKISKQNDIKYRYLKIQNESMANLKKIASTSTELVYALDNHYKKDTVSFEGYVLQREEQIRQAFEASEIAKQKEVEAKAAKEKAEELNSIIK